MTPGQFGPMSRTPGFVLQEAHRPGHVEDGDALGDGDDDA